MKKKVLNILNTILLAILILSRYILTTTFNNNSLADYVYMCAMTLFAIYSIYQKEKDLGLSISSLIYLIYNIQIFSFTFDSLISLLASLLLFIMLFAKNKNNDKLLKKLWPVPGILLLISLLYYYYGIGFNLNILSFINLLEPISIFLLCFNLRYYNS